MYTKKQVVSGSFVPLVWGFETIQGEILTTQKNFFYEKVMPKHKRKSRPVFVCLDGKNRMKC